MRSSKIQWQRLLLASLVVILPAIMTGLLVRFYMFYRITEFTPASGDELEYWHGILSFSHVGMNSGYYTTNELPAAAPFTPFGFHGPMFEIFYGSIGHFVGWFAESPPLYNLALLGIALSIYLVMVKPDRKQLLTLIAVTATFWPMLIYIITNLQEIPHQAIGIVLAGIFYRLISTHGQTSKAFKLACLMFILLVSLSRLSWLTVLLPFFFVVTQARLLPRLLLTVGKTVICALPIYLLFNYMSAPYPGQLYTNQLNALPAMPTSIILELIEQAHTNLLNFNSGEFLPYVVQRYQVAALAVVSAIFIARQRKLPVDTTINSATAPVEHWFHLLNLSSALVFLIVLYQVGTARDFRVLAPYLLLSLLVMLAFKRMKLLWLIILVNLILIPQGLATYRDTARPRFRANHEQIDAFGDEVQPYLIYDPDTDNRWCNTLLSSQTYDNHVTVPAGIGLSIVEDDEIANQTLIELPPKSRYLLLSNAHFESWGRTLNAELLATVGVEYGTARLLLNHEADCEPLSQSAPDENIS